MTQAYRFNFYVNAEHRMLVARVIGDMPSSDYVEQMSEAYAKVEAPWTYSRLIDFRRFDGHIVKGDIEEMARRWADVTEGQDFHAYVAIVSFDPSYKVRSPIRSPYNFHETLCHFMDYHEAIGWLLAADKDAYLDKVRALPGKLHDDGRIRIV